jgi:hypothetical protein
MSWDLFVQKFPIGAKSISDLPKDFHSEQISTRTKLIAKIRDLVPEADFSNPAWGLLKGENFSLEINLGEDEMVSDFAFHAQGLGGDASLISDLLNHLQLRAVDSWTGDFFCVDANGAESWRKYRNKIVQQGQ